MTFSGTVSSSESGINLNFDGTEYACYDSLEHAVLISIIAEGNKCMELRPVFPMPKWYNNKILWMSIGLVLGGGAVYGITR